MSKTHTPKMSVIFGTLIFTEYLSMDDIDLVFCRDYPEDESNHIDEKMASVSTTMPQSTLGNNPYLDVSYLVMLRNYITNGVT